MFSILTAAAAFATLIFAGAALYITLVEHPARMSCPTEIAMAQWAPSYRRATLMQAPLAICGGICSALVWGLSGELAWLIAALLIVLVVPFTLIVIMKVNQLLLGPGTDPASTETRALLKRWGRLHAVRTVLSLAAAVLMLWELTQPWGR